jgi:type I restriction enzyme S subunit
MQTISEVRDGFKETEIGLIPEDWKVAKLKDVSDFKNGINFTREQKGNTGILTVDVLNMYDEGLYVNLQNLYRVNKKIPDEYLLRDGDILFVRSSLKQEGVGWASLFKGINEPVTFCGFIIRARLKSPNISPDFLAYFLRSSIARKRLVSSSGKVAITNINQGMLGALTIPIPPFIEQQKIAFILSKIQQAIQQQDKIIEATKNLKKSLTHKLFTEGTRGEEQKETEIGLIPESWKVLSLSELVEKTDIVDPRKTPEKTFKYIDVSSISREYFIIKEYKEYKGRDAPSRARKAVKNGDIIFATVRPSLRRIAIIPESFDGEICSTAFCVIRCKKDIALPEFVFYYISTDSFVKRVSEVQKGTNYPAVTDSDVLAQKIPLPQISEQQQIVDSLRILDKKMLTEERRKIVLQQLFKTMLNKLMTGEIRVKDIDFGVINVS